MQHASRFFMWPGGRTHAQLPFLQRSLQEGRKRMLLHHEKVSSHELKSIHSERLLVYFCRNCAPCLGDCPGIHAASF